MRKGVYPYKYIYDWKKFNETSLSGKEVFYSNLNMDDVTDADYPHGERVCKDFKIKNSGDNDNLNVKSNTLLSPDVFENFSNVCLEICKLDPARFITAAGSVWQAALKKTKVRLDLLTDIDMLLKSDSHFPTKNFLFASMIVHQK